LRGDYEAIPSGRHVVAFTRGFETSRLVCAVVRHSYVKTRGDRAFAVGIAWGDEALAVPYPGVYRNLFTGAVSTIAGDIALASSSRSFPSRCSCVRRTHRDRNICGGSTLIERRGESQKHASDVDEAIGPASRAIDRSCGGAAQLRPTGTDPAA